MSRMLLSIIAVAILTGAALGLLFPVGISHASSSYSVYVYPGGNGYLTCGWHQTCLSPYVSGARWTSGTQLTSIFDRTVRVPLAPLLLKVE